MADDEDILDPKQLGRSKEEEGRFTLTPAERKLARQTSKAGRELDKDRLTPGEEKWVKDQQGLPNPSPNPFERDETKASNYARGGMVKHGSGSRAPAMCKGGKVISTRSY